MRSSRFRRAPRRQLYPYPVELIMPAAERSGERRGVTCLVRREALQRHLRSQRTLARTPRAQRRGDQRAAPIPSSWLWHERDFENPLAPVERGTILRAAGEGVKCRDQTERRRTGSARPPRLPDSAGRLDAWSTTPLLTRRAYATPPSFPFPGCGAGPSSHSLRGDSQECAAHEVRPAWSSRAGAGRSAARRHLPLVPPCARETRGRGAAAGGPDRLVSVQRASHTLSRHSPRPERRCCVP